jgi:hypothetical protein
MNLEKKTSGQDQSEGTQTRSSEQFENRVFPELIEYEHLRITPDTNIPKPVPVITINGETISTEGNITTISGASKSGKSAFTGWILAGAISSTGMLNDPLPDLYVEPNSNKKAVLHFDTEQAKHKHQGNVISILHRAGLNVMPDYFLSYNIRQLGINEYRKKTIGICEAAGKDLGGIHLIVVDGIADYIKDVNDAEQSNEIVKFFEDIAIRYRVPIIVIVHTNPGSEKERGHLGSQCQRKSESLLHVKQEGDISYVEPKLLRMAGKGKIPLMQFTYDDEKKYHVSCGVRRHENVDKEAAKLEMLENLAAEVFVPPTALKDKDCQEQMIKAAKKGTSTVKGYLSEMRAHNIIVKGNDNLWRLRV